LQTKKSPISQFGTEGKAGSTQQLSTEGETGSTQPPRHFGRQEHLKKRVEISRVFKKGRFTFCSGAKLFFLANGLPYNRIVITFAKKYGNAVKRNRVRRLSQEAYRLMKEELKTGYDLVLLVFPQETAPAFTRTTEQLKTLFKKAGMR
jgi:ribonuclease P protein component